MDQKEFNELFAKAMEEYVKSGKPMPKASQMEDTTPSSAKTATEEKSSAPRIHTHKSKEKTGTAQPESPKTTNEPIQITADQLCEMYTLLRDVCRNILDPTQGWDALWDYNSKIMDFIREICPEDASMILAESLAKTAEVTGADGKAAIYGFQHLVSHLSNFRDICENQSIIDPRAVGKTDEHTSGTSRCPF